MSMTRRTPKVECPTSDQSIDSLVIGQPPVQSGIYQIELNRNVVNLNRSVAAAWKVTMMNDGQCIGHFQLFD